jgi:hypothetical protein
LKETSCQLTRKDVHVVDYQRSANLEEFGRIVKVHENRRKSVAPVNQYQIELGTRQLMDDVRRLVDNELNIAGIDVCRSAVILNSIGLPFVGRNASMLATIGRENDCAQAGAGLQSL